MGIGIGIGSLDSRLDSRLKECRLRSLLLEVWCCSFASIGMSSLSWIGSRSVSGGMYAAEWSLITGASVEMRPSHCDSSFS